MGCKALSYCISVPDATCVPWRSLIPLQVRRILDVIRGRSYEEALMLAEYMPYRACETILKVLMSVSSVRTTYFPSCVAVHAWTIR